ncbi:MAG: hypothetical protein DMD62_15885 [Gemmatimonadetes bacterium]|nr:MAG: hypothetical protein DMD62_15885 [Gemmatimonadota bacterium]
MAVLTVLSGCHGLSGLPSPVGIITTSPTAESVADRSEKLMLPLRPDSELLYSPTQSPASADTSVDAPTMGTWAREAEQAVSKAARGTAANVWKRNMSTSGDEECVVARDGGARVVA